MSRKSILIGIFIIVIILIGFWCLIMFNGNLNKSKSPTANPVIEKEDTDTVKESNYGTEKEIDDAYIQLEYPNKISYTEMKQFEVSISNYPVNAVYCEVSADLGSTSISKIYLEKENQIIYYFPDDFDSYMFNSILFEFYDENSKLIDDTKITIEYDKEEKKFQIFEMKIK